jgi:hypothetical protein
VVRDFQTAPAQVGAWLRGLEEDGRLPPAELERARRLVVTLGGSAFAAEAFGAPSDGATGGLPEGVRDGDQVRAGVTRAPARSRWAGRASFAESRGSPTH